MLQSTILAILVIGFIAGIVLAHRARWFVGDDKTDRDLEAARGAARRDFGPLS